MPEEKYTKKEEAAIRKLSEYIVAHFSNEGNDSKYFLEQLKEDCKTILKSEQVESKLLLGAIQSLIKEGLVKEVENEKDNYLVLTDRVKTFIHMDAENKTDGK
jgi:hypothetical protein